MSGVSPIVAALLPHIAVGVACAAALGLVWLGGGLGGRLLKRARNWLGDGPSVERFRALALPLRGCRVMMMRHYENRGGGFIGALPAVSKGAGISTDFNALFNRLTALKIPVFEALSYRDDTPRGRRFWVAYMTDTERLARWGNLKSARNGDRPHLTWHSGNVTAGGDAEGPIGAASEGPEE